MQTVKRGLACSIALRAGWRARCLRKWRTNKQTSTTLWHLLTSSDHCTGWLSHGHPNHTISGGHQFASAFRFVFSDLQTSLKTEWPGRVGAGWSRLISRDATGRSGAGLLMHCFFALQTRVKWANHSDEEPEKVEVPVVFHLCCKEKGCLCIARILGEPSMESSSTSGYQENSKWTFVHVWLYMCAGHLRMLSHFFQTPWRFSNVINVFPQGSRCFGRPGALFYQQQRLHRVMDGKWVLGTNHTQMSSPT